jgi:hypothetical protein
MDKGYYFDRNLLALSKYNQEVCSRLSTAEIRFDHYKFSESRSGELIPAWVDPSGSAHPLHSVMDPRREAKRLIDSVEGAGFLILMGLGGGFYAEAALEREETGMVLVVEYGIGGLAELLCRRDYTRIFGDPRFRLLADLSGEDLEKRILSLYRPALYGGIRAIPLRSRTSLDAEPFNRAAGAIEVAIEKVSADYSVQAHFGRRWFSNIIRNLKPAVNLTDALPPVRRAAVCAAGPSLTEQIPRLRQKELFLIASDTSLPCLLYAGITPDAVISLDCQHISYYHFMDGFPEGIPLFLDLASPPLLASLSRNTLFFSGGHPLTQYISLHCRNLPELDTSGGNVTYAGLSLAEQLGAKEIELYGADFSYPMGESYARGAYIHPFFERCQNRLFPLEAQKSAFLFRTPLEKKFRPGNVTPWYYETKTLRLYRERLEEKSRLLEAVLIPIEGWGAPINIRRNEASRPGNTRPFSGGKALMMAEEFLRFYQDGIAGLPEPGKNAAEYLSSLKGEAQDMFTTILPLAAALRQHHPQADFRELFEETKAYCIKEIDCLIGR